MASTDNEIIKYGLLQKVEKEKKIESGSNS
jgi:hypothetical protein